MISDIAPCLDIGMEMHVRGAIWKRTSWQETQGDINLILSEKEKRNQLICLSAQAQVLRCYKMTKYNKNEITSFYSIAVYLLL